MRRKAQERLEEASDRLARELLKMATDPGVSESVRLSAIKDALDRGGVSAKSAVEVEVEEPKPWEQIMSGMTQVVGGSRAEFRRSQELCEVNEKKRFVDGGQRELAVPIEAEVLDYPRGGGIPNLQTNASKPLYVMAIPSILNGTHDGVHPQL